jgi:hypothetical protein
LVYRLRDEEAIKGVPPALIPFERGQHLLWQRCIEVFSSFEFSLENAKLAFFRGGRQCNKLCQGFTRFGNNDFSSPE